MKDLLRLAEDNGLVARKSMKNWTIQSLETNKSGFEGWNTYAVRAENNVHIASIGHVDRFFQDDTLRHAKIISSAPELLASCQGLLKYAHSIAEDAGIEDGHSFWAYIEDAADAIAKATN